MFASKGPENLFMLSSKKTEMVIFEWHSLQNRSKKFLLSCNLTLQKFIMISLIESLWQLFKKANKGCINMVRLASQENWLKKILGKKLTVYLGYSTVIYIFYSRLSYRLTWNPKRVNPSYIDLDFFMLRWDNNVRSMVKMSAVNTYVSKTI